MSGWNTTDSWGANDAAPSTKAANWNTGETSGADWNDGAAAANNDAFNDNGFEAVGDGDAMAGGEGGGDDRACRICQQVGHLARECPDKPEGFGKCFNCGEEGQTAPTHASSLEHAEPVLKKAMLPAIARTSHLSCAATARKRVDIHVTKQRHMATNSLSGHITSECTKNKVFDLDKIADLPIEEAWENVVKTAKEAVESRDLDDFREALKVYTKAVKDISYQEIERSFRTNDIGIFLIGTEPQSGEISDTHTLVNLAGKRDCKYKVGFFFKKTPRTAKMAEGWPSSEEENLERLKDAGVPYERGVPKCLRCKEMGHTSKDCKEERQEFGAAATKCFNCDEEGHRARDCKAVRVDRFACRNCHQSGHTQAECTEPRSAEGVECKKCSEVGHFAKDCPTAGPRGCRNCGEEGHMAKECEKPKNPANSTCRNCDSVGHFSKDCPEPKDWSKVKCNACGDMKKCPQANAPGESGGFGGNGDTTGYGNANDDAGAAADSGWETAGNAAADPSSGWGTVPEAATATAGGW
ncbi:MAG: hypothetical protein Q9208_002544 [Pyrenodesmia sp. 3 TL-2023]